MCLRIRALHQTYDTILTTSPRPAPPFLINHTRGTTGSGRRRTSSRRSRTRRRRRRRTRRRAARRSPRSAAARHVTICLCGSTNPNPTQSPAHASSPISLLEPSTPFSPTNQRRRRRAAGARRSAPSGDWRTARGSPSRATPSWSASARSSTRCVEWLAGWLCG